VHIGNLETFYWVATLGSFRKAADRLNATQPAISARIATLERELGISLFDRGSKRATLTPDGYRMMSFAERLIDLNGQIDRTFASADQLTGIARLGVSESLASTWFPDFLVGLRSVYPGIAFEMHIDTTVNLRAALAERELDVAFLMGPISDPAMVNIPLCSYRMCFAASAAFPTGTDTLTSNDLARLPLITFPRSTRPYVELREHLRSASTVPPRIHSSGSLDVIVQLMKKGLGIGALPRAAIEAELAAGTLVEVTTDTSLSDIAFTATYPIAPDATFAAAIATSAVAFLGEANRF
jgi:DNA-binding transcriptional LysR family regulator